MTNPTNHPSESKRPRLARNCNRGNSTLSNNDPRPDTPVSSSRQPPPPVVVDLIFTYDTSPTSNNIESALCVISDVNKRYTNHEILQALTGILRWSYANNNAIDRRGFLNEFLELAGLARVLKFLLMPNNICDTDYVEFIGKIIGNCTDPAPNYENLDITQLMAKKFVEKDGILTMLLANEEYNGGSNSRELQAVYSIWAALGNVFDYDADAIDEIKMDDLLDVLDSALATLRLLNGTIDAYWVPRIIHQVFRALQCLMRSSHSKLDAGDFEGKNVFRTCLDAMKDSNNNQHWDFNEQIWYTASLFFSGCFYQKSFATQNNDDDLKLVLSFYVEYIKEAPNNAFKHNTFAFLRRASDVIGKAEMVRTPGLMSTIGALLDPSSTINNNNSNSNNIEAGTYNAATEFVHELTQRSFRRYD